MALGFDAKRVFLNQTGLGEYGRFVLRGLLERYPDRRYHLYTPRQQAGCDPELPTGQVAIGLPPGPARRGPGAAIWRSFALGRRAARDGVQLFHGLSQELPRDLPRGMPCVVTIADLLPLRHPEFFPAIDRRTYRWKSRWAANRADLVIALSQQTAGDLVTWYGIDPTRIRVIGMGCHPRFSRGPDPDGVARVHRHYQLPGQYALMVGRLEARKNARLAVEALALLAPADRPLLVLAGAHTADTPRLLDLIRARQLEAQVRLLGPVPAEDLPPLYQGAGVFLYPSLFEGFGVPTLEAFRSRVPVITSLGEPFQEVGGGAAEYLDPRDPAALAAAMGRILNDRALAETMRQAGEAQATRFDPIPLADRLMAGYRELHP
jgi:glycosyltransferase involved in cell wall biosynthesis